MTVLLGIIADSMPKSNAIPLLGFFKTKFLLIFKHKITILGYYVLSVILLCALAVSVSTTIATLGRKMIENHKAPSNLAYKLTFARPRLSSVAVPFIHSAISTALNSLGYNHESLNDEISSTQIPINKRKFLIFFKGKVLVLLTSFC